MTTLQRLRPVVFQLQLEAELVSGLSRKIISIKSDVRSGGYCRH